MEQETDRRAIDRSVHVTTKEQELDHFIALANEARRDYEAAGQELAKAVTRVAELHAVVPVIDAFTRMHSADLRARTAIAAIKAIGGWI